MTNPSPSFYYPNQMGRIILLAMEEVIGHIGVNAILNLAALDGYNGNYPPPTPDLHFPFEHVAGLQEALEKEYGPRSGRGIAFRTGRSCFKYGLREFGPLIGLTDLSFRLLPLPTKLKMGSQAFADLFNKFTHQRVRLEVDERQIHWVIERCPVCWGRHTDGACCHLAVGLLQESLYWASGGKIFQVEETECIASGGSACKIVIDQVPIN